MYQKSITGRAFTLTFRFRININFDSMGTWSLLSKDIGEKQWLWAAASHMMGLAVTIKNHHMAKFPQNFNKIFSEKLCLYYARRFCIPIMLTLMPA